MNLPNKLTVLRVLLIPVFMVFAASWRSAPGGVPGEMFLLLAGIVFAAASFTDFLDGYLARKHKLVTDFGKFMDPLADKILTTTAFLYMMADGVCDPVVLVIIITREFAVSGVRMIAASSPEGKVIAANWWGKAKTVLQMLTIIFYYIGFAVIPHAAGSADPVQIATWLLCWLVALVTLVSGVQYIWANRAFINTTK